MCDLQSVLEVRDKAAAIKHYCKAKGDARESQNSAGMIAGLAEGRAGQLIRKGQADGTIASQGGDRKSKSQDATLNLEDLNITRSESSRMQLAAEVLDKDPEWFEKTRDECTAADRDFTKQAVIRRAKELRNEEIGGTKTAAPRGKYDVIVIDPPWPIQKVEREIRPNQAALDYPVMQEDELQQLSIPAADDCHLWLWTTHKFFPMALRLIPSWNFKYVCTFVWHKAGGFQPFGLPQYNCEFAIYCRRGGPKFTETTSFFVCNDWPRAEHSVKPDGFYDLVRRVTSGKRLDMFARRKIKGFKAWGNQVE